jgi:hypothetical protein
LERRRGRFERGAISLQLRGVTLLLDERGGAQHVRVGGGQRDARLQFRDDIEVEVVAAARQVERRERNWRPELRWRAVGQPAQR